LKIDGLEDWDWPTTKDQEGQKPIQFNSRRRVGGKKGVKINVDESKAPSKHTFNTKIQKQVLGVWGLGFWRLMCFWEVLDLSQGHSCCRVGLAIKSGKTAEKQGPRGLEERLKSEKCSKDVRKKLNWQSAAAKGTELEKPIRVAVIAGVRVETAECSKENNGKD
jgi:hypothetical protein